jgi:hypothetical protein
MQHKWYLPTYSQTAFLLGVGPQTHVVEGSYELFFDRNGHLLYFTTYSMLLFKYMHPSLRPVGATRLRNRNDLCTIPLASKQMTWSTCEQLGYPMPNGLVRLFDQNILPEKREFPHDLVERQPGDRLKRDNDASYRLQRWYKIESKSTINTY